MLPRTAERRGLGGLKLEMPVAKCFHLNADSL